MRVFGKQNTGKKSIKENVQSPHIFREVTVTGDGEEEEDGVNRKGDVHILPRSSDALHRESYVDSTLCTWRSSEVKYKQVTVQHSQVTKPC